MKELKELEDLYKEIKTAQEQNKVLLVDCFATWCGPCRKLTPMLDELSSDYPEFTVVKVDVGESDDFSDHYDIMSIQILKYYINGKVVETVNGFMEKEDLIKVFNKVKSKLTENEVHTDEMNVDEVVLCEEVVVE